MAQGVQQHNKRIIGVWAQGAQGSDLPDNLDKYADAVVGWQAGRVMDAINGKINNCENPDGTPWSQRNIVRIECQ